MLGRELEALINRAREYKKEYGDSFVSIEHLILSFCHDQRFGKQLFRDFQISQQTLKSAIEAIRGRQSVIDQGQIFPAKFYFTLFTYVKLENLLHLCNSFVCLAMLVPPN